MTPLQGRPVPLDRSRGQVRSGRTLAAPPKAKPNEGASGPNQDAKDATRASLSGGHLCSAARGPVRQPRSRRKVHILTVCVLSNHVY